MMSSRRLLLTCAVVLCLNITLLCIFATNMSNYQTYSLILNKDQHVVAYLPDDFLSIGIDTSEIRRPSKIDFWSQRLRSLASELAPARLRLGGTLSDRLIFSKEDIPDLTCEKCHASKQICAFVKHMCKKKYLPFFIMTGKKFSEINKFCRDTNLKLLFTLNVLLRRGFEWNDLNAKELLSYAISQQFDIDWQLGNEPNSFNHTFNITVTPKQLGNDFRKLKSLLYQVGYRDSLIVGPDTTRPQPHRPECLKYMVEFLDNASDTINVRAWHQYYLNSRTATLEDFWDVNTFYLFEEQIQTMKEHTLKYIDIPMWLTETSSSYGGGAPGISNSYAATPLWLDKLGLSAKNNITTVFRQSLVGGNYSLLDKDLNPLPDWWVSVLYKKLVGNKVLDIKCNCSKEQRFYMHCTKTGYTNDTSAVTVYGMNLQKQTIRLTLKGTALYGDNLFIDEYVVRAPSNNRKSTKILLNGWPLSYNTKLDLQPKLLMYGNQIVLPPYSVGFWVIKNTNITLCQ